MRSEKKIRVLMAGPFPEKYAGVSKVVGMILNAEAEEVFKYIIAGAKGNKWSKFVLGISGIVKFFWALLFFKPDLVHLHVSNGASIARKSVLMRLGKLFRVPVILHLHGFIADTGETPADAALPDFYQNASHWLQNILLWMLNHADGIIVLSSRYANSLRVLTDNPNLFVLINPVVCADYASSSNSKGSEQPSVLFVGDFSDRKGAHDLLMTLPIVRKEIPQVKYVFCGQDHGGEFLKVVESEGLRGDVLLPGFVSGDEKKQCFREAEIFVLPSYQEGVPIAILEAMAAGLPIVSTPVGGIPDVLANGENAILVKPGDVPALSQAILKLFKQRDLRIEMGKKNSQKAYALYDIKKYMDSLSEVYKLVWKAKRGEAVPSR